MLELDITPKQQEYMKVISIGCIANSIVNGLNIKEMDRIKLIVITSYSIHYTKLYETLKSILTSLTSLKSDILS